MLTCVAPFSLLPFHPFCFPLLTCPKGTTVVSGTCVDKLEKFNSAMEFSIETSSTIGYGNIYVDPTCHMGVGLLVFQELMARLIDCFWIGPCLTTLSQHTLPTGKLREDPDGLLRPLPERRRSNPPVPSRCGSVLPSASADVRSPDDVITSEGLVFLKLARPEKRMNTMRFSKRAAISVLDGEQRLMFRIGDLNPGLNWAATELKLYMFYDGTTKEGVHSSFRPV